MIPARYQLDGAFPYDPLEPLGNIWTVEKPREMRKLLRALKSVREPVALDYETDGVDPTVESPVGKGWITTMQLSWIQGDEPNRVWIDARHPKMLKLIKPWLMSEKPKVIHNYPYEAHISLNHGSGLGGLHADTLQLSKLVDPERLSHALDGKQGLAVKLLGVDPLLRPMTKEALGTFKIKKDGKPGKQVELRPMSELVDDLEMRPYQQVYGTNDTYDTILLYYLLREKMEGLEWGDSRGLWGFYEDYHRPYQSILVDIERQGFAVDTDWAEYLSREFKRRMDELDKDLWRWAKCEINWNSWQQKQWFLFGEGWEEITQSEVRIYGKGLPMPPPKPGEDDDALPSTDQHTLRWLVENLPYNSKNQKGIIALQERTRLATLVKGTLNAIQPDRGMLRERDASGVRGPGPYLYVHGSINPLQARTGRLSMNNPNLQQVPTRTNEGALIRSAFCCEPGQVVLCGDYSQLELRILAYYLIELFGDHVLAEDLKTGDLHQTTADRLTQIMGRLITRALAKNVNFGIVYGITKYKISSTTGMSLDDAQRLLDSYFKTYPGVKRYAEWAKEFARTTGAAQTILGRYRFLRDLGHRNNRRRGRAERQAMNTPIQGSAQDIMQLASLSLYNDEELASYGFKMRLQVHDEIVSVCKAKYRREACVRKSFLMSSALDANEFGGVELPVETHWGLDWGEAKGGTRWAEAS